MRVGSKVEDMVILHAYQAQMEEAVARYPADRWRDLAARVGVPVQTVRSPEEALLDPLLVADGCATEIDDPEGGPLCQVGRVVHLSRQQPSHPGAAPRPGEHAYGVVPGAAAAPRAGTAARPAQPAGRPGRHLASPLEGVLVL